MKEKRLFWWLYWEHREVHPPGFFKKMGFTDILLQPSLGYSPWIKEHAAKVDDIVREWIDCVGDDIGLGIELTTTYNLSKPQRSMPKWADNEAWGAFYANVMAWTNAMVAYPQLRVLAWDAEFMGGKKGQDLAQIGAWSKGRISLVEDRAQHLARICNTSPPDAMWGMDAIIRMERWAPSFIPFWEAFYGALNKGRGFCMWDNSDNELPRDWKKLNKVEEFRCAGWPTEYIYAKRVEGLGWGRMLARWGRWLDEGGIVRLFPDGTGLDGKEFFQARPERIDSFASAMTPRVKR